ncbi:MAG: hypothetical protein ACRD1R_15420 [Acidobacteriota bacterium]
MLRPPNHKSQITNHQSPITSEQVDGGIAMANPYNGPIEIFIEMLDAGLEVERQCTLSIPANGHKAVLLSELLPGS